VEGDRIHANNDVQRAIVPSELVAGTIAAMVKGADPPPGTTLRRVSDTAEHADVADEEVAA
jgi:hypothetical protein